MNSAPTGSAGTPWRFRALSTRAKLRALNAFSVAMLAVLTLGSLLVLRVVDLNGPLYNRIARSKDLVSDVLPPPLFVVESHLHVLQLVAEKDPAQRAALLARLREAKTAFDQRSAFWAGSVDDAEALGDVIRHGRAFFDTMEKRLLPALARGDEASVDAALAAMRESASRNRAAVVELVNLMNARAARAEADGQHYGTLFVRGLVALAILIALATALAARSTSRSLLEGERALKESEARFRAMIEKSSELLAVVDADTHFTFWSPGATRLFGWTAEELLGRCATDLVHPDDRAAVTDGFRELQGAPSTTDRITMRMQHKDGSWRVVETVRRNLLHDPAVRGMVVNGLDITEQQRLEEESRQAQRLESIGRLAGGIAHDFNNLLTVILSCAAELQADLAEGQRPSASAVRAAEEIRDSGERAKELTRQLLAFARKQIIAPVPLDLNAAVRRSENLLRRLLGENIVLTVTLEPEPWPVRCDPGQLEQVIINLAVNARDAMPSGGTLAIETGKLELRAGAPTIYPQACPGQYTRLVVRDSGTGIANEVKPHIFEPFFTTKARDRSTGLGLATVYGIVRQSGGVIRAESEPGRGTAFEILLPRTAELAVEGAPREAAATGRGVETVLVVEDERLVREVTVRALQAAGYQVIVAEGGREALALPSTVLSNLRLLVTDVVMPGLDGHALADEMVRRYPGLRVLFVSGYSEENIADFGEFLPKPFTPAELLAKVRGVLDKPHLG
jgi:two-component system cell cycle sensor histidine kinase/response regulator CckA